MFCENCGTKNPDGAAFCENCGAKLTDEAPQWQQSPSGQSAQPFTAAPAVPKEPRKPMSKKTKALIIALAVLVVLCVGGFNILKSMASPDKVVKGYFNSFINGNYEEAYSYLDVTDSEFVTAENFAKAMKELYGEGEDSILNYSVQEERKSNYSYSYSDTPEDSLKKVYTVKYTKQGDSHTYEMNITLLKQSTKKFLFFDKYKVAVNKYIASDYEFRVPSGSSLYIGDVLVAESYKYENEDGYSYYDYYKIPAMFEGNYDIKVTGSFMKDKEFSVYVESNEYANVNRVELNEEVKAQLQSKAEEYLKAYITSAIEGKDFDTLSGYYSEDASLSGAEKTYNSIKGKKFDSEKGTGVTEIVLGNMEFSCDDEYSLGSSFKLKGYYQYDYTSYYKYWSDDEPTEYSPEEYESKAADVYFVLENGEWKISGSAVNIYLYC